jgi:hypothetical protein
MPPRRSRTSATSSESLQDVSLHLDCDDDIAVVGPDGFGTASDDARGSNVGNDARGPHRLESRSQELVNSICLAGLAHIDGLPRTEGDEDTTDFQSVVDHTRNAFRRQRSHENDASESGNIFKHIRNLFLYLATFFVSKFLYYIFIKRRPLFFLLRWSKLLNWS